MKLGDSVELTRTITDADIRDFARVVGDDNPLHLDDTVAKQSRFGRRIAHGMLGASLFSTLIGTRLPGPGSIYLGQTLKFRAPIYPGDTVKATVKVTGIRDDKPIATLETVCVNSGGEVVIEGEAVVMFAGSRGE